MSLFTKNNKPYRKSFSQQGEDLAIEFIMRMKNIKDPFYIDIGSNHPIRLNNTYLFYQLGGNGICIDPNPIFSKLYKKRRPKDHFINAGISSDQEGTAMFYMMDWPEFSTFDKEQALKVQKHYKGENNITKEVKLPLIPLKNLYPLINKKIDLLSIDIEGLDYEILSNWDFEQYPPSIICVECKNLKTNETDDRINNMLIKKGYELTAFNPINSIYSK